MYKLGVLGLGLTWILVTGCSEGSFADNDDAGSGGTLGAGGSSAGVGGSTASSGGGPATGSTGTSNLFVELAGKSESEVDAKLSEAVNRFFGIGTGEPATPTVGSGYRCYYELPQDPSQAFIWAADSADIRSEGMSYGMMIALQMDMHEQFDKLWKFAKTHMQYADDTPTTPWKRYFRWQGTVDSTAPENWPVSFPATQVPAPDGDEYFAAALYLADRRWGSAGTVNYQAEADAIATALLHNTPADSRFPIVHATENQVVFVPYGDSNGFTDPSYHLPAFYELFAQDGPSTDSTRWRTVAETSRAYFVTAAHTTTGLHPDYATFAGVPTTGSAGDGHDQFKYDAWRVVMNMAIDYAWYSADAREKAQIEKYHAFFAAHLGTNNVTSSLFYVDGSMPSGDGSTALTATLAAGALGSSAENRLTYVNNLWNVAQQSGEYRYYQEGVYLLGLLATAGRFDHSF